MADFFTALAAGSLVAFLLVLFLMILPYLLVLIALWRMGTGLKQIALGQIEVAQQLNAIAIRTNTGDELVVAASIRDVAGALKDAIAAEP